MLFKLEESSFILCICLILLTSCIIMYYFHTRVSMIENSVSKQNQVLADFFSTVQNDLRSNTLGQDINSNNRTSMGNSTTIGGKNGVSELMSKNSKIEVSDDEVDSDSDSDSESDLDLESESESDKEDNNCDKPKSSDETSKDYNRRKLNRDNEIAVSAIEELVEEKEKLTNDSSCISGSKLDIKEIFLSNSFHGNINDLNSAPGMSSLMFMISSSENIKDKHINDNKDVKTCIIEDVSHDKSADNDNNVIEEKGLLVHDLDKKQLCDETDTATTNLKKMKITKLSAATNNSNSSEKENNKKESVAELRNKAVLLGLVGREETAKLKKSELLELIKNSGDSVTMDTIAK